MDLSVILTALVAIVAILGGLWKIVDGFNSRLENTLGNVNKNLKGTLEDVNNTLKANTSLLFKRFDDHKEATDKKLLYMTEINDKKYAHFGICELTRSNFEKVVSDINRKLDLLLEERRNK